MPTVTRIATYCGILLFLTGSPFFTDSQGLAAEPQEEVAYTRSLFDGKTLAGWEKSQFDQQGDASVKDGTLVIHAGKSMSGVNWQGQFPTTNYEVTFEAQRVDGTDFFCGLTFPVGNEYCTFVAGGWSGTVVGLSCINGYDASDNETTSFGEFENGKWYKFRVRVSDAMIKAWIDDEKFASVDRAGKEFSLRFEVDPSRPFGFATYETTAAIRNLKLRQFLPDGERLGAIRGELDVPYAGTSDPRQRLDLLLPTHRTAAHKPLPVLVYIHGGGWSLGDKQQGLKFLKPFVETGDYAGVSIGYRLSQDATWPAQIHDCKAAIRWIRAVASRYNLDADRIAAIGHSAGGHLVSMLGTSDGIEEHEGTLGAAQGYPSGVACVIDYFGPSDFRTIGKAASKLDHGAADSLVGRLLGGAVADRPQAARDASPVEFASSGDPPFLIIHGTRDEAVPFSQSVELEHALEKAGVPATLLTIEGGGHGGLDTEEIREIVAHFLEQHLLGKPWRIEDQTLKLEP